MAGRCWVLFLPAVVAQLTATDFVPYYNYNGGLAVAGTVTVTTDGTSQTLDYSLSNVDPLCGAGADSDTANSCGVHVHQGTTCTDDAGSHWYDDETITEDPWASVSYLGVTSASDTTDPVDTGYDDAEGLAPEDREAALGHREAELVPALAGVLERLLALGAHLLHLNTPVHARARAQDEREARRLSRV